MQTTFCVLGALLGILGLQNEARGAALMPGDTRGMLALPLVFEKNEGQADKSALFVSRGGGFSMSIEREGIALALGKSRPAANNFIGNRFGANDPEPDVFSITLEGSQPDAEFSGDKLAQGRSNYFVGDDPTKWLSQVPQFLRVKAGGIYPGVDLVYYGNQRQLEYDFNVAAGSNPAQIRFAIKNVENLQIAGDGGLIFRVGSGYVQMHKPVAFQEFESGAHRLVDASYALDSQGHVSFKLGSYDRSHALVIDPVLNYSSYLGGSGDDEAHAIAVDSLGKIYVAGKTTGSFPTSSNANTKTYRGGPADAFVSKIDPTLGAGGLVWSTYLGGAGFDEGNGIAVDSVFSVYVCGDTTSTNFPKTYQPFVGANYDAFIVKLNSTGSTLTYSAKLGGGFDDFGSGLAVDSSNRAYMTGLTYSTDFPTNNPLQTFTQGNGDAFVLKLSTAGNSLIYSTYLGGGGHDEGLGIAVDSAGRAYVTGDTNSINFPQQNAASIQSGLAGGGKDAFATKLTIDGAALLFSTYLGGSLPVTGGDASDVGVAISVDTSQSIYLAGYTSSSNFPRVFPVQPNFGGGTYDGFITKIKSDFSGLAYSTYFGGDGDDEVLALALDANRNAYVAGETFSDDFPAINAFQDVSGGGGDAFLSKINSGGSAIVYSSYLGGAPTSSSLNGSDVAYGVALGGPNGNNAYVTGYTFSDTFPTAGGYQSTFGGTKDAFISSVTNTFVPNRDDTFTTGAIAPTGSTTGWSVIGLNVPGVGFPSYDPVNTAYRANVSTSTSAPRYTGVFTNVNESMPYSSVNSDHYVRVKYYVYAGGQSVPSQLNTIPNFRIRAADRFAVTAILNVSHHLGNIPGDQSFDQELRPSTDPTNPSIYRVDFDPVDVPYLVAHASTDTILRSFEAASLEPQENGYVAMTESVIGTYPVSATPDSVVVAKTYQPTVSDAGNLKVTQAADLAIVKYIPGDPLVVDTSAPQPLYSEGTFGVTLDTASIPSDRIGIITREFNPGADPTSPFYLRVEEAKQYKIRFHMTSTQQSNRNAEVRMRARTIRFGWSQNLELGGAWAIGTNGASGNAAVAGQALPGIGCQNPDKDGSENGGYYTLILTSPMNIDIRPESLGPLSVRMPNISSQPGPQQAGTSLRDLRVALDLIDTFSPGANAPLEAGNVTLDKIEVRTYPLVDD